MATYTPDELEDLPTLCVGQCCSLKIDLESPAKRVWLCRVGGGVTIEHYFGRKWQKVSGDCYSVKGASDSRR